LILDENTVIGHWSTVISQQLKSGEISNPIIKTPVVNESPFSFEYLSGCQTGGKGLGLGKNYARLSFID